MHVTSTSDEIDMLSWQRVTFVCDIRSESLQPETIDFSGCRVGDFISRNKDSPVDSFEYRLNSNVLICTVVKGRNFNVTGYTTLQSWSCACAWIRLYCFWTFDIMVWITGPLYEACTCDSLSFLWIMWLLCVVLFWSIVSKNSY